MSRHRRRQRSLATWIVFKALLLSQLRVAYEAGTAIKQIIGRRQEHGDMPRIKERAEAVLKLRCIEVTGAWDEFERDVHDPYWLTSQDTGARFTLQTGEAAP